MPRRHAQPQPRPARVRGPRAGGALCWRSCHRCGAAELRSAVRLEYGVEWSGAERVGAAQTAGQQGRAASEQGAKGLGAAGCCGGGPGRGRGRRHHRRHPRCPPPGPHCHNCHRTRAPRIAGTSRRQRRGVQVRDPREALLGGDAYRPPSRGRSAVRGRRGRRLAPHGGRPGRGRQRDATHSRNRGENMATQRYARPHSDADPSIPSWPPSSAACSTTPRRAPPRPPPVLRPGWLRAARCSGLPACLGWLHR